MEGLPKWWRRLRPGVLSAIALLAAGCADDHPSTRILFKDATVNGVPQRLALDTGSASMMIFEDSSKHANMEIFLRAPPTLDKDFEMVTGALAKPARVNLGGGDFTIQPLVGNLAKFSIMVSADNSRLDGFVSWPEVRDNILIFDGPQHELHSVAEVPPEVRNWPKFTIGHENQFTLKTPLANGQLGTILIDTGAYDGVALPPAQWKEWRAAHPNGPTGYIIYGTPGVIGAQSSEEAWADEIHLGALTLTDVPVHMANEAEVKIDPKNYTGTLGLYALARLEFVVDGKHGVTYARPRPMPGPYYPGIARPGIEKDATGGPLGKDWMVDGQITINPSHMLHVASNVLLGEAVRKFQDGDHAGGIAECTQAIDFDAKNDEAYLERGKLKQVDNDDAGSLADFNKALEINPTSISAYSARASSKFLHGDLDGSITDCSSAIYVRADYGLAYFQRGAAKQAQNDMPGAIADYDEVCKIQPSAALPQLYREILQRWSGRPPRDLSNTVVAWADLGQQALGRYLSGHLSEADLMAAASTAGSSSAQICQAYYFTGFMHFLNQDTAGARERWQKSVSTRQTKVYEYVFAGNLLKFTDPAGKQ